ncbi:hypothetical protein CICLE_v10013525mg, partial [Citrus x clementina]
CCRYFVSTTVAALFSPRCCSDSAQSLLLRLRPAAAASSLLSRCCSVFTQPLLLSRICHLPRVPGVKPYLSLSSDEDRELQENFLSHGVHVDIDDDDSMEPLFETRTQRKRHRRPVATSTERVMNARIEMVKGKSAESTSQCVEKWYIEECIEAVEKLGDINGDTYNKQMDKLVPSIEWRKAFLSMLEHKKKYWLISL